MVYRGHVPFRSFDATAKFFVRQEDMSICLPTRTCSAPDAAATTAPRRRVAAKNLILETFFEVFMGTVNVWIVSLKQNDYGCYGEVIYRNSDAGLGSS